MDTALSWLLAGYTFIQIEYNLQKKIPSVNSHNSQVISTLIVTLSNLPDFVIVGTKPNIPH